MYKGSLSHTIMILIYHPIQLKKFYFFSFFAFSERVVCFADFTHVLLL